MSLLAWVHGVTDLVPARDTADADLAAPHTVLANPELVPGLEELGYKHVAGNRFERTLVHGESPLKLAVDLLAPGYQSRLVSNVSVGEHLVVDEVPGLPLALAMPPTWCQAQVRLTTAATLTLRLPLPSLAAALCLKAFAYRDRLQTRDALDIWRLLECLHATGMRPQDWPLTGVRRDAAASLHHTYARPGRAGPERATLDKRQRQRIRALLLETIPVP